MTADASGRSEGDIFLDSLEEMSVADIVLTLNKLLDVDLEDCRASLERCGNEGSFLATVDIDGKVYKAVITRAEIAGIFGYVP